MEVRRSGRLIPLTYLEFSLLRLLVANPGQVFSRQDLIRAAWPRGKRHTLRTVDTSIWRLRRKLEQDPACPLHFQTVRQAGYKFVPFQARRI